MHDAGIEVILDVVYNHTAEGNQLGPTLSFRGIDNKSYYFLIEAGQERYYNDFTGTGNALELRHRHVLRMVTDSLRYWVEEMRVDGFRFDLATTLARVEGRSTSRRASSTRSRRTRCCPRQADRRAVGHRRGRVPGGPLPARLGRVERPVPRHRAPLLEGRRGQLADARERRFSGSADIFDRRGRRSWASVNFVTAHDGFTLRDLVSYDRKHNEANGEGNRDGVEHNHSWNHGVEGPTDDPRSGALRNRQMRNLLATLLVSQGTPMLLGGDEFGRTKQRQQQRLLPGQRAQLVRLGGLDEEGEALLAFTRG
jgi:isoamylase